MGSLPTSSTRYGKIAQKAAKVGSSSFRGSDGPGTNRAYAYRSRYSDRRVNFRVDAFAQYKKDG